MPLIECVVNVSEGRRTDLLAEITETLIAYPALHHLLTDSNPDANRTVLTFAGRPEVVLAAAAEVFAWADRYIDLRVHSGAHPRMGAVDVCPFVPLQGIYIPELVDQVHEWAAEMAERYELPVFLYEHSAMRPEHRFLADIRKGEYEQAAQRLTQPGWRPDLGPTTLHPRLGQSAIGVRRLMIALNLGLLAATRQVAQHIATEVRHHFRHIYGPPEVGRTIVRTLAWWMQDYGLWQLSMNLYNPSPPTVYQVYTTASRFAQQAGSAITGTELIGLIPETCLSYIEYQLTAEPDTQRLYPTAIQWLKLDAFRPFHPQTHILEKALRIEPLPLVSS